MVTSRGRVPYLACPNGHVGWYGTRPLLVTTPALRDVHAPPRGFVVRSSADYGVPILTSVYVQVPEDTFFFLLGAGMHKAGTTGTP